MYNNGYALRDSFKSRIGHFGHQALLEEGDQEEELFFNNLIYPLLVAPKLSYGHILRNNDINWRLR